MTIVKISNGEVTLKSRASRKLRKQIDAVLYKGAEFGAGEEGGKIQSIKIDSINKSNDAALVGMAEKIVIDGKEMPVTIETFDEMDANDVDIIIAEVNKITKKEVPNA